MIRAGNTGTADIEVYVLPNGRVGDARIVKSTGFEALDRSALEEAKRKWRLAPATRDGVPFAQWHRLRVTFRLNQQRLGARLLRRRVGRRRLFGRRQPVLAFAQPEEHAERGNGYQYPRPLGPFLLRLAHRAPHIE